MRFFLRQRKIAALAAALTFLPLLATAQEIEGRPSHEESERPDTEGRGKAASEEVQRLEDRKAEIDKQIHAIEERAPPEEKTSDDISKSHVTEVDKVARQHDLTKPGSAEFHDMDMLLREANDDARKNEIHTKAEEVVWRSHVDLAAIERLNVPDKNGQLRPDEASAAAELESFRNYRLERADKSSGADFIIVSGLEKGKTVDFMLTAESTEEGRRINDNIRNYPDDFRIALRRHVEKVDIVPIDARHLDKDNIKRVESDIADLPEMYQGKIMLIYGD